jgi:hypothetical protein
VSLEGAIGDALEAALRERLPALLAQLQIEARMLPIKAAPVSYRAILAAEKAGEIAVYRVGKASLVDTAELYAWIRQTGLTTPVEATPDDVGELLELDRERRAKRGKGRAA